MKKLEVTSKVSTFDDLQEVSPGMIQTQNQRQHCKITTVGQPLF